MWWDSRLAVTAIWTFGGTCCYLIVPETAAFLLPLTMLAPTLWYPQKGLARRLLRRSLVAQVLAVTTVYLLINASWSTAPTRAYVGVATFFVGSVVVHVITSTVPFLGRCTVRAMSIGFYAGYAICVFLISLELLFQHPIHMHFFALFPTLAPQMTGVIVESGFVKSLPSFFLNKHVAALTVLMWPALLIASCLASSARTRASLLMCLSPTVVAIFASDHESSKMAIVGGAIVFCIYTLFPRVVKPLLAVAWIFACAAVVPLTSLAFHQLELHKADWLQSSARHRIVIWGVSSAKIREAPIFGQGMVSTRELGLREKAQPTYAPGTNFMLSPGPHSHNVYLQFWFDTGLVGVMLMCTIGLFALGCIARAAANIQSTLYAAFATNALLASSSFSIWSHWFLTSYVLSVIFAVLAWKFASETQSAPVGPGLDRP